MLKSFCIKTNNNKILNYLLKNFEKDTPNNFYCSKHSFKIYENVIFHYKGENRELYLDYVSECLTNVIIQFYESKLILNILNYNYFYFSDFEKKDLVDLCTQRLNDINNSNAKNRKNVVFYLCKEYVQENKSVILDGFIKFRLKEYTKILDEIVDECVNAYVIEKEYLEFIELLRLYIKTTKQSNQIVHLIYYNHDSLLLDDNKKIINFDYNISSAKYLSDITFSSNDYCLNTLLNIIPKKIYIHLIDENEDEFITTLKSIFEKKVSICYDCNLCNHYKIQHLYKSKKNSLLE